MIKKIFISQWVWLLFFLIAGGCASLFLRYELLWDFANYHYYNPWAFLNNRWMYDIVPAGVNTFFNPVLDLPIYGLIKYFNDHPDFIIFVQGLWSGAATFMIFLIAKVFFDASTLKGKVQIFFAVAIAITSWPFFMQIGTTTNEMQISLMVLFAWWLLFKEVQKETSCKLWVFGSSGLVLGMAAGLKLTAGTYCVSTGIAIILCYKLFKPFLKLMMLFILGGVIGFLITNGFWMWNLWQTFDNPVFPLLNNIFKSEWFDELSYRDKLFLSKDALGYVFYPFYMFLGKLKTEGNSLIIDIRLILLFFIFVGSGIYAIIKICKNRSQLLFSKSSLFLFVLCLVSYIVWLLAFSIQRYSIQFLVLGSILIVKVITFLYPKEGNGRFILYSSFWVVVVYSLISTPWYSDKWGWWFDKTSHLVSFYTDVWPELKEDLPYIEKYGKFTKFVDVEDVELPDNTLLQIYDRPESAVIPVLAEKSNIRAINMYVNSVSHEDNTYVFNEGKWLEWKKEVVSNHKGPKAILISLHETVNVTNVFYQQAKKAGMECHLLINNIWNWLWSVPPEQVKEVFKWRYQEKIQK